MGVGTSSAAAPEEHKSDGLEPNADRGQPLNDECTDHDKAWLQAMQEFSVDEAHFAFLVQGSKDIYTTVMIKLVTLAFDNAILERGNEF